ncbi:DUF2459 domain-containing protein [Brevundimonas sp.]|uniref:DUF2459 domain-containing protein n=1 Tax=Brevundimonas sp. TaxID=1871086 RepID=UPI0028AAC940|nr:DUF2459 domain-containing protein [Brevundimonas sp.]
MPGRFLIAALIGLAAALWTLTRPGDPALYPARPDEAVTVHLLDNGFHTDLAVPRAALMEGGGVLAEATASLAPGGWVLIGWGDATFYVDQSPISGRLADGARAFLKPGNPSVVMLDPQAQDPTRRFRPEDRRALRLSPAGMRALRARVQASLATDAAGRPVLAAARPGDDARFFASRETFWIGHLCNHWTADLLSAAGLPIRPWRAVTSGEVMRTADRAATLDLQTVRD